MPPPRLAPEMAMVDGAVSVTVPPQTEALAFGTLKPAGRVSLKATPVMVLVSGLLVSNCSPVVPPKAMDDGMKLVAIAGGLPVTESPADAAVLAPPSLDVTFVVTLYVPTIFPVTVTVKMQLVVPLMVAAEM